MKRYLRFRTADEVEAACKAKKLALSRDLHDALKSDFVLIAGELAGTAVRLFYSTINGRFMGETGAGESFNTTSQHLEGVAWYEAVLELLYEDEETAAAPAAPAT